ncbi:MAG: hypothetical protein JXR70_18760 [Spirochaetales bacterium]|nr:hypothetical protein [Spirochaetales bacterium]
MKGFHLTISSAENIFYQGEARFCKIQTQIGQLGIEKGHEPLMAILNFNSTIVYRTIKNEEKSILAESGLFDFRNNICTLTISTQEVNKLN